MFFKSLAPASIAVLAFVPAAAFHWLPVSTTIDRHLDRLLHVQKIDGGIRFIAGTPEPTPSSGRVALLSATAVRCAIGWFAFVHHLGQGWFADADPMR